MRTLEGKIVVVTGASAGLGAAFAVRAATLGAKAVILNYATNTSAAEVTADAVRSAGAEAILAQGDVAEDAVCRAIAESAAPFGRIDGLINNAAITSAAQNPADLDAIDRADFERVFAVNVIGPIQMVRAARALLEASEQPSILMVSSITGVTGLGPVAYAASKGALNTMTLSLARTLAPKIRVNAICPGFIDTAWWRNAGDSAEVYDQRRERMRQRTPLKAASLPEDIADAGVFFLTDAARHVTGETLLIDAGLHLGAA